jgi:cytochrome c peroxidase
MAQLKKVLEEIGVLREFHLEHSLDAAGNAGLAASMLRCNVESGTCGLFRTPTLRNTAIRQVFFHNGRFHSLREVLRFYVQRDTSPEKRYPIGVDGRVYKFNDLPPQYRKNVDTADAPLDRKSDQ